MEPYTIGFYEQHKHLRKVLLQQKRWKKVHISSPACPINFELFEVTT